MQSFSFNRWWKQTSAVRFGENKIYAIWNRNCRWRFLKKSFRDKSLQNQKDYWPKAFKSVIEVYIYNVIEKFRFIPKFVP